MKPDRKIYLFLILSAFALVFCMDNRTIVDTNMELVKHNWSYAEKVRVPLTIEENSSLYNIQINLRHTSKYRYSNIFLLVHVIGPDGKRNSERKEFKLALPDGEWLGSGSGNLYSYQLLFKKNYKFPSKGKYMIELEQNMRDNPLNEITDAGIRVEKSQLQ